MIAEYWSLPNSVSTLHGRNYPFLTECWLVKIDWPHDRLGTARKTACRILNMFDCSPYSCGNNCYSFEYFPRSSGNIGNWKRMWVVVSSERIHPTYIPWQQNLVSKLQDRLSGYWVVKRILKFSCETWCFNKLIFSAFKRWLFLASS